MFNAGPWSLLFPQVLHYVLLCLVNPARGGDGHRGLSPEAGRLDIYPMSTSMAMEKFKPGRGPRGTAAPSHPVPKDLNSEGLPLLKAVRVFLLICDSKILYILFIRPESLRTLRVVCPLQQRSLSPNSKAERKECIVLMREENESNIGAAHVSTVASHSLASLKEMNGQHLLINLICCCEKNS